MILYLTLGARGVTGMQLAAAPVMATAGLNLPNPFGRTAATDVAAGMLYSLLKGDCADKTGQRGLHCYVHTGKRT